MKNQRTCFLNLKLPLFKVDSLIDYYIPQWCDYARVADSAAIELEVQLIKFLRIYKIYKFIYIIFIPSVFSRKIVQYIFFLATTSIMKNRLNLPGI